VLRRIDSGLLTCWVEAEDRHRQASIMQAKIDQGSSLPRLAKSKDGTPIPSPYLRIMNQAADVMLRCAAELGFSPASRPRLVGPGAPPTLPDPASPWARLRVLQGGRRDDESPQPA
jgi:P27 family predicted phage terminase small subunit